MDTHGEKLSILSEMIAFARADGTLKMAEYTFLLGVAHRLGVDRTTFDALFDHKVEHIIPKSEADRILQFHRLLLLMNVDREQHEVEIERIHTLGLHMGLPPSAIDQVLIVMHNYPDNIIPPKVLIDIFKAYHN